MFQFEVVVDVVVVVVLWMFMLMSIEKNDELGRPSAAPRGLLL